MPELRYDPVQRRWVILATERRERPHAFLESPRDNGAPESCPFCEGNESETPPEILSVRLDGSPPDGPGWRVRVVPNKYPALRPDGEIDRIETGLHSRIDGVGVHEVIIENPEHGTQLADSPIEQVERVIWAYRERLAALSRNDRLRHVLIFKNHGPAAGATLSHPHTQIIGAPVTPLTLETELSSAAEHYRADNRCIFCDIIEQEIRARDRIVEAGDHFVAVAPFASRFPFEILVAPRYHQHSFEQLTDSLAGNLAVTLKSVLSRIKACLGDPAFNFLIHTAPNERAGRAEAPDYAQCYHWHAEILPRITGVAGFEWGTGSHINPIAPEEAAKCLREAAL